ncbi:hypothetical protein JKP88DRAFT_227246 [Tribonema minus]|uniref:Uncharacterized protein n=1 Tax=Tribonema minus TaxID=303371 RepID=A0A836C9M5_9STRA|nr:hypothetical protein JKP88DRAFT_227246 [Tribonema minus]
MVDDSTGNLQFNAEDPAALLSLALQYMQPMRPLMEVLLGRGSWPGAQTATPAAEGEGEENAHDHDSATLRNAIRWELDVDADVMERVRALLARAKLGSGVGGDGGKVFGAAERCLPLDDIDDMLAYVAGHKYLQSLLVQPNLRASVAAGYWEHVEELAREVCVFAGDGSAAVTPLANVADLTDACLRDAPALRRLESLLRAERTASLREALFIGAVPLSGRKRLRVTSAAAAAAGADPGFWVQFPEVQPGCRHLMGPLAGL